MINNLDSKPRPRSKLLNDRTPLPRLSLSLHTMPQTSTGHFKKWLVLGLIIFGLMVIVAILAFWS
ncbi:MAG: hypothetical protein WC905_00110 [Patescibacteria group bacterium]|jgi:hypothetical protein